MHIKNKAAKILMILFILCPIITASYIYLSIPAEITISSENVSLYQMRNFFAPVHRSVLTASDTAAQDTDDSYTLSFKLFNCIPFKNVNVSVMPKIYVIPSGEPIGVKIYTDGILIVGISYVTDNDGNNVYPAKDAGIREGDIIRKINGTEVNSVEEMTECINAAQGNITATIERGKTLHDVSVTAQKCGDDGIYRMGIWVRDTAAGVGTMTFYSPETKDFASLGHAITDIDTGDILKLGSGRIISCRILSVNKGEKGEPGELIGTFTNDNMGNILINSGLGVYGKLENYPYEETEEPVAVATRFEIQNGSAYILADTDGNGVKKYDIEILRAAKDNSKTNKGIVFKVTDSELLEKTGGIVQGMSGCPIIQNDMLIGAVTHVFINDPTKGYGIFAENMIDMINTMDKNAA